MNLVTVIIPMYNESNNIQKCIKNLCEQSNQKFDVIFVDDGSKDGTLEKLKKILTDDIKFNYQIKSQENQGAASARKNGIENSKTHFIMMLDCDDRLSVDAIEEVYSKYKANVDVDIIIPNMLIQGESGEWDELKIYTDSLKLDPMECVKNTLDGWLIHGCFTIKKEIFLKSYKDYSEFNPQDKNFINNDEVLTRLNFMNSSSIVRSLSTYFYYFNPASTTKKINQNKYLIIHNTLILNKILSVFPCFSLQSHSELISTIWGVYRYKKINKDEIIDPYKWDGLIKNSLKKTISFRSFFKLSFKRKIQLILLKAIYVV